MAIQDKSQPTFTVTFFDKVKLGNPWKYPERKTFTFDQLKIELEKYYNSTIDGKYTKLGKLNSKIPKMLVGGEGEFKGVGDNILTNRSIITIDVDGYIGTQKAFESDLESCFANSSYIAHSTSSSTPNKPRCRIILPLDKPVLAAHYSRFAESFISNLNNENIIKACSTKGKDHSSSRTANKLMFLPFKPADNENYKHFMISNNGDIVSTKLVATQYKTVGDDFSTDYIKSPVNKSDEEILAILLKHDIGDMEYQTWVNMGMALHHQYEGGEKGLLIWNELSKGDEDRYKGISDLKFRYEKFEIVPNCTTLRSFMRSDSTKQGGGSEDIKQIYSADFPHTKKNKKGEVTKVKSTYENFKFMCDSYCYKFSFDKIRKKIIHDFKYTDMNSVATKVGSLMSLNEMDHRLGKNFMGLQASENIFNSFEDILKKEPWDGVSRINDFFNTVKVKGGAEKMRDSWMLSYFKQFLHLALTTYDKRIIGKYTLFLKGAQGIGKTPWVERLLPLNMREDYVLLGATLNVSKPISVFNTSQKLIVELGEIVKTTFKVTSEDEYKSHTGKKKDSIDIKYQPFMSEYDRTTSFIGTLNEDYFLRDPTGSARYLVLDCLDVDGFHNIDMLQVYREILVKYDCRDFQLCEDDRKLQAEYNEQFYYPSLLEEQFLDNFEIETINASATYSCTDVLQQMGYNKSNIDQRKRLTIGGILRKYNFKMIKRSKTYLLNLKSDNNSNNKISK